MEYLPIKIDFQNKAPLSEQIAERMRLLIRAGVLKPADPLPTVRQLAFQLGVNFNTVARAYRALDAEGLIITWQGRGTFVEERQNAFDKPSPGNLTARRLVDLLYEQAQLLNIPEVEIWEAINQRRRTKQNNKLEITRKTRGKFLRRFPKKVQTITAGRGITLRRTNTAVYTRVPGRSKRPRNVSRGTI